MKKAAKSIFSSNRVCKIKISEITENVAQPRVKFDERSIERLAESIARNGLLQPLSVRRKGKGYELISGERRLRALKLLGYEAAPCIIVSVDDENSAVLALIENIQREDLSVFEQADAIYKLICQWGITQAEAAQRLGLSQSAIANKLRLLRLKPDERRIVTENNLTERHARALIRIEDEEKRRRALLHIAAAALNVEQSEKYIEKLLVPAKKGGTRLVFKDLRIFQNTIKMAVDTMRRSGVMASAEKGETDGFIEYTIRIPKPTLTAK
ncbi:MAG: ParB/RepB/Spo0J family partition protein [Oscillospiraceae bacterium]|nr:ParB/RepB/Spo0J family partition protein [Oscillospiraceae bacterium]